MPSDPDRWYSDTARSATMRFSSDGARLRGVDGRVGVGDGLVRRVELDLCVVDLLVEVARALRAVAVDLRLELGCLRPLVVDRSGRRTRREDEGRERRDGEHEGDESARQSGQHEPENNEAERLTTCGSTDTLAKRA